ncbi:MAG: hypothetical protein R2744_06735 [Bacteroidales bacterium]
MPPVQKIKRLGASRAGIPAGDVAGYRITRKSIDARRGNIKVNLSVEIWDTGSGQAPGTRLVDGCIRLKGNYRGSGPAGLFAALGS